MLYRMRAERRDSPKGGYVPFVFENYDKIKVTFLSRNTTYRKVLNEKRLLDRLRKDDRFVVKLVTILIVLYYECALNCNLFYRWITIGIFLLVVK